MDKLDELLQEYEGVFHYCGQDDCVHQESYNKLRQAILDNYISKEDVLKAIEKAPRPSASVTNTDGKVHQVMMGISPEHLKKELGLE